jgi:hypothetical protein
MKPEHDTALRRRLADLIAGRGAHVDSERAIDGLPPELRGTRPPGFPHTPWQLLEHLRIAQWDLLEYCRNPDHESPEWPRGYWPEEDAPPSEQAWEESVEAFRSGLEAMAELVRDPGTDLFAEIPWSDGHTVLREALLLADHNAYHVGQIVTLRRALGAWPGNSG